MTISPPRTRSGRLVIWAGHKWRVQRSITIQLRVHMHIEVRAHMPSSLVVARRQLNTSFPVRRTYCRFLGNEVFVFSYASGVYRLPLWFHWKSNESDVFGATTGNVGDIRLQFLWNHCMFWTFSGYVLGCQSTHSLGTKSGRLKMKPCLIVKHWVESSSIEEWFSL